MSKVKTAIMVATMVACAGHGFQEGNKLGNDITYASQLMAKTVGPVQEVVVDRSSVNALGVVGALSGTMIGAVGGSLVNDGLDKVKRYQKQTNDNTMER